MPRYEDDYEDYDDPEFDDPRYEDYEEDDRGYDPRPRQRSGVKRWLIYIAIGAVGLPLTCCGGLLFLSMTYKTFAIKNAQHLGGSAVNVTFEYEVRSNNPFLDDSFQIVAETADGQRVERPVPTRFQSPGRFVIHSSQAGPAEASKSPVRVWIEKSGGSKASNVLKVPINTD